MQGRRLEIIDRFQRFPRDNPLTSLQAYADWKEAGGPSMYRPNGFIFHDDYERRRPRQIHDAIFKKYVGAKIREAIYDKIRSSLPS